jgi:Domain of unknown function (DUF4157)
MRDFAQKPNAAQHTMPARPLTLSQAHSAFSRIPSRFAAAGVIQKKSATETSPDPYEQEAERIAAQLSATPARSTAVGAPPRIGRLSGQSTEALSAAPARVGQALGDAGTPLEGGLRRDMEQRFAFDFSGVRVHADTMAAEAANTINARAFTAGHHVMFGSGQFAPSTVRGRHLLAHELTHVVQQSGHQPTVQRAPGDDEHTSMFIDPYANTPLPKLRQLAKQDPEAAESLRLRYRRMPDAELSKHARSDPIARSVRDQRIPENTPIKNLPQSGYAKFSNPDMYDELSEIISASRAESGIPRTGPSVVRPQAEVEGGVIAAGKTNVKGLEDAAFVGKSPKAGGAVNPHSAFAPATDPVLLPHTHGHAEQNLADELAASLRKLPPAALKEGTVWLLVEQMPCSTCASGIADPAAARGVLRKLSEAFPNLTFEIKHLDSNKTITLRNGEEVVKGVSPAPKVPPKVPQPPAGTGGTGTKSSAAVEPESRGGATAATAEEVALTEQAIARELKVLTEGRGRATVGQIARVGPRAFAAIKVGAGVFFVYSLAQIRSLKDAREFVVAWGVGAASFSLAKRVAAGSSPVAFVVSVIVTMPNDQGEAYNERNRRNTAVYEFLHAHFTAEEIRAGGQALWRQAETLLFETQPFTVVPTPQEYSRRRFEACMSREDVPVAAGAEPAQEAHNRALAKCYPESGYREPKMVCTEFGCTPED